MPTGVLGNSPKGWYRDGIRVEGLPGIEGRGRRAFSESWKRHWPPTRAERPAGESLGDRDAAPGDSNASERPPASERCREAERRFRTSKTKPPEALPDGEGRAPVHELQVYQIELEMQNEGSFAPRWLCRSCWTSTPICSISLRSGTFCWTSGGRSWSEPIGAALLGLERGATVKSRLAQFVVPEDRAAFADFCRRVLRTDTRQTSEFRLVAADHTIDVLVEGLAAADVAEETKCWRAAVIDISAPSRLRKPAKNRSFSSGPRSMGFPPTLPSSTRAARSSL